MENDIKLLDIVQLQKYIYLIELFVSNQIEANIFDHLFIQIRRDDSYWMSSEFDRRIEEILNTFFLDIDEFSPDELLDPNNKFNINEAELRKRANKTLIKLKELLEKNRIKM